jgi:molecular chaperone GrpE
MMPQPEPADTQGSLIRAMRELDAALARVERDAQIVHDETRNKLVVALLPVLDNLDRAIAASTAGDAAALVEGVQLVRAQLEGVLRGYGIERIDAVGVPFDPSLHDAICVTAVHDPTRHAIVLDQTEAGYRFGERLLRPAKVVVGRAA